ncbi:MAG: dephospho-CoA kinase [Planctomycetaceae bacterium]|nr:dephospho-CoA kinase [Planctomycetaceae bacterium]
MKVIGILGGVASGKSLVADQLRRLGAEILNADQVGHEVLREAEVIKALRERWRDDVIDREGQINRAAVAKIVFASPPDGPEQLAFLEQITHPRIGLRLSQQIEELSRRETEVVVLDAPVMLKAGWDQFCDHILFVETEQSIRRERARRRGWIDEAFAAREDAQKSLEKKRSVSGYVIDNSGTREETLEQIKEFWNTK